MFFAQTEPPKVGTPDRTSWVINQVRRMSFSKRLAWLIRQVGVREFSQAATHYGCGISYQRFQRLASRKQKLLRYKAIKSISPNNLAAIQKALNHIADFDVTYSMLLDGPHKELRERAFDQIEEMIPQGIGFRDRLVLLRTSSGHPYRGSFVKRLRTIEFKRYAKIERGKNGRDMLRPHEYSEIRKALGCSYSILIEGKPANKKGPG